MNKNVTQVHNTTKDELINEIINGVKNKLQEIERNFQPKQPTVWITKKEVATILSISIVTVDDWSKKDILNPFRIGNRVRFKRNQVEAALTKINS